MPAFAPRPSFNAWDRNQQIGMALDQPFTFGQTVGENFQQGILDSFGLGSVVRDIAAPAKANDGTGRYAPADGGGFASLFGQKAPDAIDNPSSVDWRAKAAADFQERALTKEQYESSPNFRTEIPWEKGMTEARAAALAGMYDVKQARAHFSEKQPIAAFLGQLGGQALDPINYVPVFGQGVQAAAVARVGGITGRALLSASEAAINTAAFGVATAGIRAKYGDDVSFESITTDIAMSAIIGGIFGAGIGTLARGADRRAMALKNVRPRLETIGNVMQARAVINDAVQGLVTDGEVRLNPNSTSAIERMADQVVERTAGVKSLRDETARVTGSKPGEVVISPSGARVQVRPEVVEASSLIRATGALQVRDRTSAASAAQVEDIALNLDPARLMPNIDASQGAPLVGGDNIIDSGNGRVLAIKRAYEAYPDKAAAYRAALVEAGYADAAGMQQPVLVNRRITELSETARAQFNAELNGPTTARMSAVELAALDREALTPGVMDALDDAPVTAAGNRAFVQRFLANLPQNERGAMLERDGKTLNADGARRIENALVAAAYGDVDAGVLRRFAEATDDNTRAIVGALSDVAGTWARMRGAIKRQEVGAEFDLTPELTQALRLLGRWRDDAAAEKRPVSTVIREGLAQLDMLSGEVSPEAQTFIRMFYADDHFGRAVGRDVLTARLKNIADSTIELGRPSLFGDVLMPTKGEVLTNAQRDEADTFAADGLEPRAQEGDGPSGAEAGGAGGQGAAFEPTFRDLKEDDGTAKAGDTIIVYRLGKSGGELSGRNGGNAEAIAKHWQNIQDGPRSAEGIGDTVVAYAVKLTKEPDSPYTASRNGKPFEAASVGRELKGNGIINYSFPPDGAGWEARTLGEFPIQAIEDDMVARGVEDALLPDFVPLDELTRTLRSVANDRLAGPSPEVAAAPDNTQGIANAFPPPAVAEKVRTAREFVASSPDRSLDETYAVIGAYQDDLDAFGKAAAAENDATWRNPGLKDKAGAAEKMVRKGYESTQELTDLVRGGFEVKSPRDAEAIVDGLRQRYGDILDEGWRMTAVNYFDRKVLVRFDDGTIGEVQLWHPRMYDIKETRGHALYEEARKLEATDPKSPRLDELFAEQRALYASALPTADPSWLPVINGLLGKSQAPGNATRNAASEIGLPESMISTREAEAQPLLDLGTNQPAPSAMTAALPSQSKNAASMFGSDPSRPTAAINATEPMPDPVPDGLVEAAARVGKGEDLRQLAEVHGVKEDGSFTEQGEIDQMRQEGKLTAEDEAEIDAAEQMYADADAWAKSLEVAGRCMI